MGGMTPPPLGTRHGERHRRRPRGADVSLIGPPLQEISIEDLQRFLDGAETEPLLWEAKGTTLDKHDIRKAICGFANGREIAYLILGAEEKRGGGWTLGGVNLQGDPPAWISGVVADGLRPAPRVDIRSLPMGSGNHVAIVEVPPIAIPPCISRGTVYERVSGRTIPVKDPIQLAELYKRGTSARVAAMHDAATAATEVIGDPLLEANGQSWPRFALALSATGHPPDISSRLFSRDFEDSMLAIVRKRLIPPNNVPDAFGPTVQTGVEQSNRWINCEDSHTYATRRYWHIRVIWDGTVVVYHAMEADRLFANQLASEQIKDAWIAASESLAALGGFGPTHMEIRIEGGTALLGPRGKPMPRIKMGRGPLEAPPGEEMFASVERELRRAVGEVVYETPTLPSAEIPD